MVFEEFVKEFKSEKYECFFNFNRFFDKHFSCKVPQCIMPLIITNDFKQIFNETKDIILVNFYKNSSFNIIETFLRDRIEKIVKIFETDVNDLNPHIEAQIIYLLNLSQSSLSFEDFSTCFENIDTIKIVEYENADLEALFVKIKTNKVIFDALDSTINELTEDNLTLDDLTQIKLSFFESKISFLNGFAGMQKVYVSLSRLNELSKMTNQIYDRKNLVLRLFFVRLMINLLTHVVLRDKKNDFNLSSAFFSYENLLEAGVMTEGRIFEGKIDFFQGLSRLNFEFLIKFYDELIEKNLEIVRFDLRKSKCSVMIKKPNFMAIDMD
ncbi:unnamed protein product [Brachionus calyciflorus]|uniref:Uncharacterized protein n=1 Tax=Brachionus calyciflorus TaxID=104777 RepID=A0A814NVW7_9BILA|nr:unnamed protein product [Brachionus calyciflorus]